MNTNYHFWVVVRAGGASPLRVRAKTEVWSKVTSSDVSTVEGLALVVLETGKFGMM